MIGIVVATHGDLAQALITTARSVVIDPGSVVAVGIEPHDDTASFEARLQAAVNAVQTEPGGVLVLTDMFGGTPANIGLTMHEVGKVEILTGANLPMLIKALQLSRKETDLANAARLVKESGIRAIAVASEVLAGHARQVTEKSA